jgi:hypothetical protein
MSQQPQKPAVGTICRALLDICDALMAERGGLHDVHQRAGRKKGHDIKAVPKMKAQEGSSWPFSSDAMPPAVPCHRVGNGAPAGERAELNMIERRTPSLLSLLCHPCTPLYSLVVRPSPRRPPLYIIATLVASTIRHRHSLNRCWVHASCLVSRTPNPLHPGRPQPRKY